MQAGDVVRLADNLSPKYVSEALVELEKPISPGTWEAKIIEIKYRAPRNASFQIDGKCRINKSHLASETA